MRDAPPINSSVLIKRVVSKFIRNMIYSILSLSCMLILKNEKKNRKIHIQITHVLRFSSIETRTRFRSNILGVSFQFSIKQLLTFIKPTRCTCISEFNHMTAKHIWSLKIRILAIIISQFVVTAFTTIPRRRIKFCGSLWPTLLLIYMYVAIAVVCACGCIRVVPCKRVPERRVDHRGLTIVIFNPLCRDGRD